MLILLISFRVEEKNKKLFSITISSDRRLILVSLGLLELSAIQSCGGFPEGSFDWF